MSLTETDAYGGGYEDEPPPGEQRVPPNDMAAEQSVLGSMMISRDAIGEVVAMLHGADFYRPSHETIFDAILDLYTRGEPVDMITVANTLGKTGELAKVGGAPYLHTIASNTPIAANAGYYADIVSEKAKFRRLVDAGTRIAQYGYAQEGEAAGAFDASTAALNSAAGPGVGEDYIPVSELVPQALDAIESHDAGQMKGVGTGFYDLDELLLGLRGGQMITIAGRPAMGKSTLAVDIARHAAIRGAVPTCIFSLEMGRQELIFRVISAESRVGLAKLNSGLLSDQDWVRIAQHMDSIGGSPLWIDDSANLTMSQIAAKARRLKVKNDLGLVVIDYMQLMSSGKRVESRQQEVSEFSRQIKLLAKELDVPIVALSQLNRGPEQRQSKRPMMSDLRESGSIEQDSDVVMLLHREDAYDPESTRPGEADIIVAKHRNGPTRDVTVVFQGHYARFVDMAESAGTIATPGGMV